MADSVFLAAERFALPQVHRVSSVHSPVDGHVGGLRVLATVDNRGAYTFANTCFQNFREGSPGHMVSLVFLS